LEPGGIEREEATMDPEMVNNPLVGTWRLVSWENRAADGTRSYPMGPDALGILIYTGDGHFSSTLMRADRAEFASSDLLGGTDEERASAVVGYLGYCGRYTFRGDQVINHVELSLFPNWIGTDQCRRIELSDRQLTLIAGPMLLHGKQQTAHVTYKRSDVPTHESQDD
jgi:hypothetical protein